MCVTRIFSLWRVHNKHIFTANIFMDFHKHFHISKASDISYSEGNIQICCNGFCQGAIRITI